MKYMGSKETIAKDIVPILQNLINEYHIKTYIEPFCGSCSIIEKIACENRLAYDYNKYLIALLDYVAKGGKLLDSVSKELYSEARLACRNEDYSKFDLKDIGNIGFIASFNGRFFDGGYATPSYEKTKNGMRYRDYYQEAKRNIEKQSPKLKNIVFHSCDYRDTLKCLSDEKCLIYMDPPYNNTKMYANATKFDYDEFWQLVREYSQKHIIIVSEVSAPDDMTIIWQKKVARNMNPANKFRAVEKMYVYTIPM